MLDTIVLNSPEIPENIATQIQSRMEKKMGFDFEHDKILYEMTTKQLVGSYDNRIRVNINRKRWVKMVNEKGDIYVDLKDSKPYIEIELSLHKFFLGHNAFGGSDNLHYQVSNVIIWLENYFNVNLPFYDTWIVKRIDYARIYNIENIPAFIRGFNNAYYPRRTKTNYGTTGIYFPGTYTTLKIYDKEKEFKIHDRKKLRKVMDLKSLQLIDKLVKNIMRIEIEVKGRKLKHIYGDLPTIAEIKMEDIKQQFETELHRIFKTKETTTMTNYNKNENVKEQLYNNYRSNVASSLYGFWFALSVNGYEEMKSQIPKSTFYRYVKQLQEVGIVWNNTDVTVTDSIDYVFNPLNTDLEIKFDLIAAA